MPTLYDLTENLLELLEAADRGPDEGEVTPEVEDAWLSQVEMELRTISLNLSDKLENCARLVRELEAHEAALAKEKGRFSAREKSVKNHRERLKNYMANAILTLVDPDKKDRRRVETSSFLVWVQRNPMSVALDKCDPLVLGEKFVEFVPTVRAQKIIDHVKATGEIPPGAELNEERWGVRIR